MEREGSEEYHPLYANANRNFHYVNVFLFTLLSQHYATLFWRSGRSARTAARVAAFTLEKY